MSHRVLLTRLLPESVVERLHAECDLTVNRLDRPLSDEELMVRVQGMDGLLCLLTDRIDARVMDAAGGALKVISNYAVGYNNVDVAAATQRKIAVTNTPGVLTDSTADLSFALILDTVRRVTEGDRVQRRGEFPGWSPLYMLGGEVTGATLGIYGFGRIGRAVARRAKGFSMRILYHGPRRADESCERELDATFVDFTTLLEESDILTIHAPLSPQTRHKFAMAEFARMKSSAFLINTSRGPIVNEKDLVVALREKSIAGAGLDVYEGEPALAAGLSSLENVVLAPHLGSATGVTRATMADLAAENLLSVLGGRRPPHCVNPEVF